MHVLGSRVFALQAAYSRAAYNQNAFGPSGTPGGLFLASKETAMSEIAQVHASLDEAGDETACLAIGRRAVKRALRCEDSQIKAIELH